MPVKTFRLRMFMPTALLGTESQPVFRTLIHAVQAQMTLGLMPGEPPTSGYVGSVEDSDCSQVQCSGFLTRPKTTNATRCPPVGTGRGTRSGSCGNSTQPGATSGQLYPLTEVGLFEAQQQQAHDEVQTRCRRSARTHNGCARVYPRIPAGHSWLRAESTNQWSARTTRTGPATRRCPSNTAATRDAMSK